MEEGQGVGDDTALNAVELICYDNNDEQLRTVSSKQGDFGEWGRGHYCNDGHLLKAVSFRSEGVRLQFSSQHIISLRCEPDDVDCTAGNDVDMWCSDEEHLHGSGAIWGSWSQIEKCPDFMAICGIQTMGE